MNKFAQLKNQPFTPSCTPSSTSESQKPAGGGRLGSVKEAFKAQYLNKFRKSSDSIGNTSSVGSGGVQSSMQEHYIEGYSYDQIHGLGGLGFGVLHQPAWAVGSNFGSNSSGPPAGGTLQF